MPYHIRNKNSKKEMKKARNKPIPTELMYDPERTKSRRGNPPEDIIAGTYVQGTEDDL